MTRTTVISLAIIKLNWEIEGKKSYLENFIPIVAECIRRLNQDVVSIPEVSNLLQSEFGLKIPQNSIASILQRAKKKGYVREDHGVLKPVHQRLSQLKFHKIQQEVLEMHDALISHLILFCKEKFSLSWSNSDAENALEQYLEDYDILSLKADREKRDFEIQEKVSNRYILGAFISYLYTSHSSAASYIETIVEGNMLANALFLTTPGREQKKFRKTKLFFDAPFLIYALGYAGKERQTPCIELMDMLDTSGAEQKCFRHTYEEARGILDACAYRIERGQLSDAYGPSIEYFLQMGASSTDIFILSNRLERDLESLGIEVVDRPSYKEHEHVIGEASLRKILSEKINYRTDEPLNRDVDSVAAIMRERKGRTSNEIEESRAIFVTMNTLLFRISRDFIRASKKTEGQFDVPPCIIDKTLTNLLWLKNPLDAPDLPRKRLIADYYAAVQPTERLWREYIKEVEKLKQRGDVSSDDYYLLRYSLEARGALMDKTLGSENAFAQGTVPEILALIRRNMERDLKEQLASEKDEKERYKNESRESKISLDTYQQKQERVIRSRASRISKSISSILQFLVLALLIIGTWSTFPWNFPNFSSAPAKYFLTLLQIVIFILAIANSYKGTTINEFIMTLEKKLSTVIENNLRKITAIE